MYPFRNPLIERDRRIKEGELKRRIAGTQNIVYDAARSMRRLSYDELQYLRYLCGFEEYEENILDPHEKNSVGKLFEKACGKHRKRVNELPPDTMPGEKAVLENRAKVTELHKANALRKQESADED